MTRALGSVTDAPAAAIASFLLARRRVAFSREPFRLTDDTRHAAERALGHVFADVALLKEALTHTSAADTRLRSNERMEFLGDAVLDLVVVDALYRKFPDYSEGDLTKVKSAVVSRRTCAAAARQIGLDELLIVGKGIEGRHGRFPRP